MLPLVMLAMTAAKEISDKKKEDRDRWLAAQTQRFSPWTGNKAGPIEEANPVGTALQGYGTFQGMQQGEEDAAAQRKLMDAKTNFFNTQNQPNNGGGLGLSDAAQQAGAQPQQQSNFGYNANLWDGLDEQKKPLPGMKYTRY